MIEKQLQEHIACLEREKRDICTSNGQRLQQLQVELTSAHAKLEKMKVNRIQKLTIPKHEQGRIVDRLTRGAELLASIGEHSMSMKQARECVLALEFAPEHLQKFLEKLMGEAGKDSSR